MTQRIEEELATGISVAYQVDKTLVSERSPFQDLMLIENRHFGRVLMLDGATQLTTADEFIYHEMLAHVPFFAHGHVRDVLIIGGGDCGLAEEVLKHRGVRRVVQVEIDARVIETSRRYLGDINAGVFNDDRFHLRVGDGAAFLDGVDERFDLILIDSTDPGGAATKLFTAAFYRTVRRALRAGGIVVAQAGVPFLQPDEFQSALTHLAGAFRYVNCYLIASPSYFGGHLAFAFASDACAPDKVSLGDLRARHQAADLQLRYYTPEVHQAAFALPVYIGEMVKAATQD